MIASRDVTYLALCSLLAAAVWAAVILPRATASTLMAVVLVVGTFFGPAFFAIEGPLQISIDRLLLAVVLIWITGRCLYGGLRLPRLVAADLLLLALLLWCLRSALRAGPSPPQVNPLGTWIFYVLFPALAYALGRFAEVDGRSWRAAINLLLAVAGYLALVGLLEVGGVYWLVFPRYIADVTNWEFLGRARGPLLNPSANGILLSIGLSFAAVRMADGNRAAKVGYALLILLLMLGIYATLTRIVWIGGVLCLVVVCWDRTPPWARLLGLAAVIVFGGMGTLALKDRLLRMKRDKALSAAEAEKSIQLRPLLAIVAWEMFKDAPLAGHGYGNYLQNSKPYFTARNYDMPLEQARGYFQHNIALSLVVDSGLIGLTLAVLLWASWWSAARRLGRLGNHPAARQLGVGSLGAIAAYICGGMLQDASVMPMVQMYLYFLGGLVVAAARCALPAAGQRRAADGQRWQASGAAASRPLRTAGSPAG